MVDETQVSQLLAQLANLESAVLLGNTVAYVEAPHGYIPVPETLLDELFESRKRLEQLEAKHAELL
jgi:hypothetical protein